MGNRAVIALESMPEVGVYLHWNGGPESVLAFLEATKQRGARSPGGDPVYCFARLVQTIGDFFGPSHGELTCVGVAPLAILDTDNGDNGTYWIGKDWEIVRRDHARGSSIKSAEQLTETDREKMNEIIAHLLSVESARQSVKGMD